MHSGTVQNILEHSGTVQNILEHSGTVQNILELSRLHTVKEFQIGTQTDRRIEDIRTCWAASSQPKS